MIPTEKEWLSGTSNSLFLRLDKRGSRLKALDDAIRAYHLNRNAATHAAVGVAWAAWKDNHKELLMREGNARNKNAMLDLLAAEFSPDDLDNIKNCSMSRVKLNFLVKPIGFPANAEAIEEARIDKALLDAQGVLRITVVQLERLEGATRANVRSWFGAKAVPNELLTRFKQLQDHMESKLKRNETPLEIRWDSREDVVASTVHGQHYISFGRDFFDDRLTVPGWNLSGKPVPKAPDYVDQVRRVMADMEKFDAEMNLLIGLESTLAQSGVTVSYCMKRPKDIFPKVAWAAVQEMDLDGDSAREVAYARVKKRRVDHDARGAALKDDRKTSGVKASASGVIVHEMTHMVLGTDDVKTALGKGNLHCYGPSLCMHLASTNPDLAFKNADNYRLFAESCQFE